MYIIKNAFRCISRAKGRNVLIGLIVLVISVSACLGLSIQQAAESDKKETLETLSVTATIAFDRQSVMSQMGRPEQEGSEDPGSFDRSQFFDMMGSSSSLSLEEYQTYAAAESVKDFYYSMTASLNAGGELEPVSNESKTESSGSQDGFPGTFGGPGGPGGGKDRVMGAQGDFSVVGYSSEQAMTDFGTDGTASITDGAMFEEGTSRYDCVISAELAEFNDLSVGDTLTVVNPNNEEETYELSVTGIYTDSSSNESSFSVMGMTATDPANRIYMSYPALKSILDASASVSTTETDQTTGREFETAITGDLSGTYVLSDVESYERFEEEVRQLGLDDSYVVSSTDLTSYENSLIPLNTLSTTAGYFLIVIVIIGAIILIVLNIFNVRERKYEIGVLTAMGMKKKKVALQFLTEIFAVTLIAVVLGMGAGAVSSVPVTNALLENQIASQSSRVDRMEQNFGREPQMREESFQQPEMGGGMSFMPSGGGNPFETFFGGGENSYVSEISSAMNFTVVLQMLGIGILLTLVAGAVSMLFVMRYEPLKILANRD